MEFSAAAGSASFHLAKPLCSRSPKTKVLICLTITYVRPI